MSNYWAPKSLPKGRRFTDNEPPRVTPGASTALSRAIAALIHEHDTPWDPPALRTIARRIWASARGLRGPYQPAVQPVADLFRTIVRRD
jgi:hypothetical protein